MLIQEFIIPPAYFALVVIVGSLTNFDKWARLENWIKGIGKLKIH